ncbi:MAG TPA: ElyC/SanA/YdcF family protein, partial [Bacteroidia bacterium]|nr:ElyC/SanA/YdcF family protein [Bacteroidia bacterium]
MPNKGYALVLGAGNYEPEQWENHSFEHRMDATYELYAKGIIDTLIVSGLSLPGVYNEAEEMKSYLVNKGMSPSAIILDSLGVRTWVSVERMKDPFHINNFIIISQ